MDVFISARQAIEASTPHTTPPRGQHPTALKCLVQWLATQCLVSFPLLRLASQSCVFKFSSFSVLSDTILGHKNAIKDGGRQETDSDIVGPRIFGDVGNGPRLDPAFANLERSTFLARACAEISIDGTAPHFPLRCGPQPPRSVGLAFERWSLLGL